MQLEAASLHDMRPAGVDQPPAEWRRLRADLRQAVQAGGFTLVFQPRQMIASGRVVAGAAQVRWPRRRGGLTGASGLMPLLEAHGLVADVAAWSLKAACQQAAAWQCGRVAVTADAGSLRDGSVLRHVGAALRDTGLAPGRLELECGETALAGDSPDILFTLAALRDCGVALTLAGFGSETASLLPLRRLPLTALSLDRSLVRDLPEDPEAAAIVRAAIAYAHALGIAVVACGLETEAQMAFLRDLRCDEAQGSLCGHAVPAAEFAGLVAGLRDG